MISAQQHYSLRFGNIHRKMKDMDDLSTVVSSMRDEMEVLKTTVEDLKVELSECKSQLSEMLTMRNDGEEEEKASDDDGFPPHSTITPKESTTTKSSEKKKKNAAHHHSEHQYLEPISYDEAFETSGGKQEVQKYKGLSSRLQNEVVDLQVGEELKQLMSREYNRRKGFSTVLLNQGYVNELEVLYKQANRVYEDFDAAVHEVAQLTSGKAVVPPIKGEQRARMKAMFKYRDPRGDGIAWYRLTDLVRATIVYPDIGSMYNSLEQVLNFFNNGKRGSAVKELNDRYIEGLPGGYRDIQLVVQFKDHMCEVQLNTGKMIQAKQTMGHRSFEVIRELKAAIGEGDVERVVNALMFGKDTLGTQSTTEDDDTTTTTTTTKANSGMESLKWIFREKGASNLIHDAAKNGHAEIVHALLLYGADANSQDENGDTPLHHAVHRGSERCVWAILDAAEPDLDATNNDGETPLMKGYIMLWTRPPEGVVRAVATLAQYSGLERMQEARKKVSELKSTKFRNSALLVQHAGDGDLKRLNELLKDFKSPDSHLNGKFAIEAAIEGEQLGAIEVLVSFGASLETREGHLSLVAQGMMTNNNVLLKMLEDAGAPVDENSFQHAIFNENEEALQILTEDRSHELENFEVFGTDWVDSNQMEVKQVSVSADGKHVWGVTDTGNVWIRSDDDGSWNQLDDGERMFQVSVSADGSHVWALKINQSKEDNIRYRNGLEGTWEEIEGGGVQISISADGNHLWRVNKSGHIWLRNGRYGDWAHMDSEMKHISVTGDGSTVWAVNTDHEVLYGNDLSWTKIDGKMTQVSVSGDGNHLWGINSAGQIWYRNGLKGTWIPFGGKVAHVPAVSYDGSRVWGVNSSNGEIWCKKRTSLADEMARRNEMKMARRNEDP